MIEDRDLEKATASIGTQEGVAEEMPAPGPIAVGPVEDAPPSLLAPRRAPPGSSPGTLAIPPDALPTTIRAIRFDGTALEDQPQVEASDVAAHLGSGQTTWLDVTGFGDGSTLSAIGEVLGIHPLAIADIVHTPQRAKFEAYGDRYLIILHMGQIEEDGSVDIEQITLVLGPDWVATFQERPGDVFEPVRERLRQNLGALREGGPDRLAYALIDAVVDGYFPILEQVGDQLEHLEDAALAATGSSSIQGIHQMRRHLIHLHRTLWGHRQAISSLLRNDEGPFGSTVRVYLRDTHDHAIHQLDLVETLRELSAAVVEIHLSSASNRMNEVMKTLTVMASIFIPLTFLAGVYGMNFRYMPELQARWAYPAFWVANIVIAGVLIVLFWRRGWIGRR